MFWCTGPSPGVLVCVPALPCGVLVSLCCLEQDCAHVAWRGHLSASDQWIRSLCYWWSCSSCFTPPVVPDVQVLTSLLLPGWFYLFQLQPDRSEPGASGGTSHSHWGATNSTLGVGPTTFCCEAIMVNTTPGAWIMSQGDRKHSPITLGHGIYFLHIYSLQLLRFYQKVLSELLPILGKLTLAPTRPLLFSIRNQIWHQHCQKMFCFPWSDDECQQEC